MWSLYEARALLEMHLNVAKIGAFRSGAGAPGSEGRPLVLYALLGASGRPAPRLPGVCGRSHASLGIMVSIYLLPGPLDIKLVGPLVLLLAVLCLPRAGPQYHALAFSQS